jgi:hypothetical protein
VPLNARDSPIAAQTTNQSLTWINQSINQSIDQSINQSINYEVSQSMSANVDRPLTLLFSLPAARVAVSTDD